MNIAGHKVGLNHPPFIIAEMSGNHNQSLERAIDIVKEAGKSGVQAIKLQTYKRIYYSQYSEEVILKLKIKNLYGMAKIYMIFIKLEVLLGNGMVRL